VALLLSIITTHPEKIIHLENSASTFGTMNFPQKPNYIIVHLTFITTTYVSNVAVLRHLFILSHVKIIYPNFTNSTTI
jgi:hypothetical protein